MQKELHVAKKKENTKREICGFERLKWARLSAMQLKRSHKYINVKQLKLTEGKENSQLRSFLTEWTNYKMLNTHTTKDLLFHYIFESKIVGSNP